MRGRAKTRRRKEGRTLRLDELPRGLIRDQVKRLISAFAGGNQPEPDAYADELRVATRGWESEEFTAAISGCIREERFFPRISAIIKHRPERLRPNTANDASMNHCPNCRVHYFYAGYEFGNGAVVPRLRCACPQRGTGWSTDAALAWQETDPKMISAGYRPPDEMAA